MDCKCCFKKANKIVLIVMAVIIVIGAVFIGVFGFNKGYDVGTAYEVDVKVAESLGNSGEEIAKASESFFKEKGLKYIDKNVIGEGKEIVYIFGNEVDANYIPTLKDAVIAAVPESLKTTVEVSANESTAKYNMSAVWYTLLIVGVAVVLGSVYTAFRYKISAGLTVLCSFVFEAVLFVTLLATVRVPVTSTVLSVGTVGAVISTLSAVLFIAKAKNLMKTKEDIDYKEIGCENAYPILSVSIILFIVSAIVCLFVGGALLFYFALQMLLASVTVALTVIAFIPFIWSNFMLIADKLKKKGSYQQTASQVKETNE